MEKKVNILVDTELWKKVKSTSALEGKTLNQWVVNVLEKEIRKGK